jgi:hypothetical protein
VAKVNAVNALTQSGVRRKIAAIWSMSGASPCKNMGRQLNWDHMKVEIFAEIEGCQPMVAFRAPGRLYAVVRGFP